MKNNSLCFRPSGVEITGIFVSLGKNDVVIEL